MFTTARTCIKTLCSRVVCSFFALVALPTAVFAAPATVIPPPLEPWQAWVSKDLPERFCPWFQDAQDKHCLFVRQTSLVATEQGAQLQQDVQSYSEQLWALPGDQRAWPQQVKVQSLDERGQLQGIAQAVAVREVNNRPEIQLPVGRVRITAIYQWAALPEALELPSGTPPVALSVNGQQVAQPMWDQQRLLLRATPAPEQGESRVQMRVFRLLSDAIPYQLTTFIRVDVSGPSRELKIPMPLPEGFVLAGIEGDLPVTIRQDGSLSVSALSGNYQIKLTALRFTANGAIRKPNLPEPWPDAEVWAFQGDSQIRTAQLEGAVSIDPQQSDAPSDWQQYPQYLVNNENELKISQLAGPASNERDAVRLQRTMWLSPTTQQFTVEDQLQGQLRSVARLTLLPPLEPGRIEVSGEARLINQLSAESKGAGVEIRQSDLSVVALSQLPQQRQLPVHGWDIPVDTVTTTVYLPSGWAALAVFGASQVYGDWLHAWDLWDMFLVMLLTVTAYRLLGVPAAGAMLLWLLLAYQKSQAPDLLWLLVFASLALVKYSRGRLATVSQWLAKGALLWLGISLLTLATDELRLAIYPQLASQGYGAVQHDGFAERQELQVAAPAPAASMAEFAEEEMAKAERRKASLMEKIEVTGSRIQRSDYDLASAQPDLVYGVQATDPANKIQTGPALPQWRSRALTVEFAGPVSAEQQWQVYLIPAWLQSLGRVLLVLLSVGLFMLLLAPWRAELKEAIKRVKPTAAAAVFAFCTMFQQPTAQAQAIPSPELLQQLQEHLHKPAECTPDCTSIERVTIAANGDELRVSMWVHSQDFQVYPLPISPDLASQVTINQQDAELYRLDDQLVIALAKGVHQIDLKVNVTAIKQLNLTFPQHWHQLQTQLTAWQMTPQLSQGEQSWQVRLDRQITASTQETVTTQAITGRALITREFNLGLVWQIQTHVTRLDQSNEMLQIEYPLLAGEQPLTDFKQQDGKLQITLAPGQAELWFNSNLPVSKQLVLQSPAQQQFVERWHLKASPDWHVQSEGNAGQFTSMQQPVWQPWPTEQVALTFHKPQAVPGDLLTVLDSQMYVRQGEQIQHVKLQMSLLASQTQPLTLTLPANIQLTKATLGGNNLPRQLQSADYLVQIPPGRHTLQLEWDVPQAINMHSVYPAVKLSAPAANIHLSLELPHNRWLLALGGPVSGPALLFWGILALAVALAYLVAKSGLTPLSLRDSVLLFCGMSAISLWVPVALSTALILVGWRGRQLELRGNWARLSVISLVLLLVGALIALLVSVPQGLMSSPDMALVNPLGGYNQLNWYQDYAEVALPQPWVFSLPLWVYQLAMLLWALWLASSLLRWLPWCWQQLSVHGFWPKASEPKASEPKVSTPTPAVMPTEQAQNAEKPESTN